MQIEVKKKESSDKYDKHYLSINGIDDEDSWCNLYNDGLIGQLYREEAITELLNHDFSSVPSNIQALQFYVDSASSWADSLEVELIFKDRYSGKAPAIQFELRIEWEKWAKPISIIEYASFLEKSLNEMGLPNIEYFQDDEFVTNGFGFIFNLQVTDKNIKNIVDDCISLFEKITRLAEEKIVERFQANSLSVFFDFPVEIRPACEQYLMYFTQFLKDIGIAAHSEIKQEARRTLFSVTPENDDDALGQIREALSVYLKMPSYPDLESQFSKNGDIAIKQLEANIYHLKSQLMLASATIQAKDATIQAKDATIDVLTITNYKLSEAIQYVPNTSQKNEEVLGGVIKVKSADFKGFSIDFAEILRRLKRKMGSA
jgi:hypothetical protein